MPSAPDKTNVRKAPREAMRLRAPFEFAKDDEERDGPGMYPIKMLARSAEPIDHWYWGKIVHDMGGMKLRKDKLPLDYCHDSGDIVGMATEFNVSAERGVEVGGKLVSVQAGDRVDELRKKSRAGIPYEASIDFSGPVKLEEIGEGFTATVNGRQFDGPGLVVREWTLNAIAVCPLGADPNTRSQFAGGQPDECEVTFMVKQETKPEAAPAAEETKSDPSAEFKAKLAKFIGRFGAVNGSQWAADHKTYEEALELHADALTAQLTAANAANAEKLKAAEDKAAELQTQLAALPRGEKDPLSFSAAEKPELNEAQAKLANRIGPNLAKLAAGMKLPSRN